MATSNSKMFNSPDLITLTIGPPSQPAQQKNLYVSASILTKIPYFAAALKSRNGNGFKEAQEKHFTFPGDDPAIFDTFLQLVVAGHVLKLDEVVEDFTFKQIDEEGENGDDAERKSVDCLKIWVLSIKLMADDISVHMTRIIEVYIGRRLNEKSTVKLLVAWINVLRTAELQGLDIYTRLIKSLARCFFHSQAREASISEMKEMFAAGKGALVGLTSEDLVAVMEHVPELTSVPIYID